MRIRELKTFAYSMIIVVVVLSLYIFYTKRERREDISGIFYSVKRTCEWPIAGVISDFMKNEDFYDKTNRAFLDFVASSDPRFSREYHGWPDGHYVKLYLLLPDGVPSVFPGEVICCTDGVRDDGGEYRRFGFILSGGEVFVVLLPPEWDDAPAILSRIKEEPDVYFSEMADPAFSFNAAQRATPADVKRHVYSEERDSPSERPR